MSFQTNVNQFLWTTAMLQKFKSVPGKSRIFSNEAYLRAKEARAAKEAQASLTDNARDFYRQVMLGGEI